MKNNQQKDGSVKIPKVLVSYMGGKTVIGGKSNKKIIKKKTKIK